MNPRIEMMVKIVVVISSNEKLKNFSSPITMLQIVMTGMMIKITNIKIC